MCTNVFTPTYFLYVHNSVACFDVTYSFQNFQVVSSFFLKTEEFMHCRVIFETLIYLGVLLKGHMQCYRYLRYQALVQDLIYFLNIAQCIKDREVWIQPLKIKYKIPSSNML